MKYLWTCSHRKKSALNPTALFTWHNCKIPHFCEQKLSLERVGFLTTHCTIFISLWAIMLLLCHGMCAYMLW